MPRETFLWMTFEEFFPTYLAAHSKRSTRIFHACGLLGALAIGLYGLVTLKPWLLLVALAAGYLPAWCSHWFIERNTPKTFGQPLLSFRGDFLMVWMLLTGKL
ncbi:MAG: DUF962 domain-containing protein [Candidatus Eremiobacteraeota bacterium]|nr:DUF962 domain-containing protein [Candidatus Eremiobacteraeota bacterium]